MGPYQPWYIQGQPQYVSMSSRGKKIKAETLKLTMMDEENHLKYREQGFFAYPTVQKIIYVVIL